MLSIVIFGPPGSGKGTQADLLAKAYDLEHISTGNLLRREVELGTPLGKRVGDILAAGELVPDEIVNELVLNKIKLLYKSGRGFVLDGYPRNLSQAKTLAVVKLNFAFLIQVSDEEVIDRISNRVVCNNCGMTYNLKTNPPKQADLCDKCGSVLMRRDDEDKEVIKNRLKIYHKQIDPLLDFYQQQGILHKIDGEQSIENVYQSMDQIIKKSFHD